MGLYERMQHEMRCARCQQVAAMEIEVRWGNAQMRDIGIGDQAPWVTGRIVKYGGRPPDGTADWDGYAWCPKCERDFFVWVHVINDIITNVSVDATREGYTPNEPT